MLIHLDFDFHKEAKGRDPDSKSPTLRQYHQFLWSKPLPDGVYFKLEMKPGKYLYHKSGLGEFILGSDAIIHSYRNQKRKQWLMQEVKLEADELFEFGKTIASYIIFPKNKVKNKFTINQSRGINSFIDDRFDLTLECIRLYYLKQKSPLYNTLLRYQSFLDLFTDFKGYVQFFFLDDLITYNGQIKFFLPFDNFKNKPSFSGKEDYLLYKKNVTRFILARKERMRMFLNRNKHSL